MGSPRLAFVIHSVCSFRTLLVLLLWSLAITALAKPKVLASIKPLALIAQEVAGDQADIDILLPITASAHDYPLKMSDHRRLRDADLVLWVGAELESFLARPLANLPAENVLGSYTLDGLFWPEVDDHGHDHPGHDSVHQHSNGDPHIWLDPRNAAIIARAVAQRLGRIAPASAAYYAQNAERFSQSLQALDTRLLTQLAPVKSLGFAVYHEGYSHFVAHYGLHQLAYVTFTPERRPGAKHLQALRNVLAREGRCVFMEPYQNSRSIEEMGRSLGLNIGLLDPIGNDKVSSYNDLMEQLGQSFLTCLADGRNTGAHR
ncbi:zinc ABC transporter substrate-binding protein [Cellvibrio mixtus]|uniref:High-affinity zinc uptake system protein ZnuA n=1 Tax=Cellvibrio mixtus TaxID=39650 RepID=A0A266QCP7_9GAMM|nr:zinc ABC transporter substrate-binding protein [Cellvibrio mixtus]OZY87653.1 zinc ABC transporter substrate-binding protein [Cellvibrio mixtus]